MGGDEKGACGVIIVLRYNYGLIDQAWHKSLLQIISGHFFHFIIWCQPGKLSVWEYYTKLTMQCFSQIV